jgi:hypothetical protein
MSLLKRASEIEKQMDLSRNNINSQALDEKGRNILISEEELLKAPHIVSFNQTEFKTVNPGKAKIEKIERTRLIEEDFSRVKIQQEELDNLIKKKKCEKDNISYIDSNLDSKNLNKDIDILDTLISNTKIFLKNIFYLRSYEEFFDYLDSYLPTFYFITGYTIYQNSSIIHNYNIDKKSLDKLHILEKKIPAILENQISIFLTKALLDDSTLDDNLFVSPIEWDNDKILFLFEVSRSNNIYKNVYHLDFISLIITLIPPILIPLNFDKSLHYTNFAQLLEIIQCNDNIFLFQYLNFPFNFLTDKNLGLYLKSYQERIQNKGFYLLSLKKFFSTTESDPETIILKLNKEFGIENPPIIKKLRLSKNSKDFLASYLAFC